MRLDHCLESRPRLADMIAAVDYVVIAIIMGPIAHHPSLSSKCQVQVDSLSVSERDADPWCGVRTLQQPLPQTDELRPVV